MLSEKLKEDLRNPWLRGILLVIGTTVTVNIAFITYAFMVPPNLVVEDYYERGKEYFHDEKTRLQAEPTAWRLQLMLPNTVHENQVQTVRLYAMDHQGKPIHQGKVTLKAYRPNDASLDFTVRLQLTDTGTFTAPITFPLAGNWDLIARIDAGKQHFDTAARIFVKK